MSVPEPAAPEFRAAPHDRRLLAFGADTAILCVPPLLLLYVALLGGASTGLADGLIPPTIAVAFVMALAIQGLQWWWIATEGRSLGKRWSGLRIIDGEGEPPGFVRGVLLRSWLTALFSGLVCGFGLADVGAVLLTPQRRGLHDYLARTRVVVDEAEDGLD